MKHFKSNLVVLHLFYFNPSSTKFYFINFFTYRFDSFSSSGSPGSTVDHIVRPVHIHSLLLYLAGLIPTIPHRHTIFADSPDSIESRVYPILLSKLLKVPPTDFFSSGSDLTHRAKTPQVSAGSLNLTSANNYSINSTGQNDTHGEEVDGCIRFYNLRIRLSRLTGYAKRCPQFSFILLSVTIALILLSFSLICFYLSRGWLRRQICRHGRQLQQHYKTIACGQALESNNYCVLSDDSLLSKKMETLYPNIDVCLNDSKDKDKKHLLA
ncbi:unnamed protein product [Protopolystoma xenopodis]|uniref:Uncharacterized protein n=1 Tax=Protopolystoma xenopodis TaxID=117903 RepID=A0A448X9C0_9PLAT|nr:unnamed protein product [Protopolystoma xenopodis]